MFNVSSLKVSSYEPRPLQVFRRCNRDCVSSPPFYFILFYIFCGDKEFFVKVRRNFHFWNSKVCEPHLDRCEFVCENL